MRQVNLLVIHCNATKENRNIFSTPTIYNPDKSAASDKVKII